MAKQASGPDAKPEQAGGGNRAAADGAHGRPGNRKGGRDTPTSEWIVAGVSTLLVLAVLGYLLVDGITGSSRPPDITIHVDSVIHGRANYIVTFTANNVGGSTASNVQVTGELRAPGDTAVVERSQTVLDYVPARSDRAGGLYFGRDPSGYRVSVRAEGYNWP